MNMRFESGCSQGIRQIHSKTDKSGTFETIHHNWCGNEVIIVVGDDAAIIKPLNKRSKPRDDLPQAGSITV
jgi:selenophosphate synthetase-related protein